MHADRLARLARPLALLPALALLLAGCGGGDPAQSPAETPWGQFLRGTTAPPKEIDPESYRPIGVCPPLIVRAGTETMAVGRGTGGSGFQASLTDKARECTSANGQITLKIGVAGRILAGRQGGSISTTLPLRIAIVKDSDQVIYSKLFQVPVALQAPEVSARWVHVESNITIPDEGVIEIYVGFDTGSAPKKPAPTGAPLPEGESGY